MSSAAVPLASTTPSQGDQENAKRERSRIDFPYTDLRDAEEIATAVHNLGTTCTLEQLAGHLQNEPSGGGFRGRLSGARMFGLIGGERGNVALTDLGSRLFDPQQMKAARVEAFLTVPLYSKIYDQFKGKTLPPNSGLEAAIVNMGVVPKQKERARQAFQRSAKLAGFLDIAPDRLVIPVLGKPTVIPPADKSKPDPPLGQRQNYDRPTEYDPLIEGLLKRLPQPETAWSMDSRKRWLQAALNIFDVMYTDPEGDGIVVIDFKKKEEK
jgi:hypothetical protein